VPWPIVRDHMEKDLKMRPYRPTFMIELSDADMDWRYVSPYAVQRVFSVVNMLSIAMRATEICCSGQRRIPISRRRCNIVQHVMIWAGMTLDYLIESYFFDEPVNAASYSAMLETWLKPRLRDRGT
jgi:hypothetical protein